MLSVLTFACTGAVQLNENGEEKEKRKEMSVVRLPPSRLYNGVGLSVSARFLSPLSPVIVIVNADTAKKLNPAA